MAPAFTLEDCIAKLGRDRALELLQPHCRDADVSPPEPPDGLPYHRVACVGVGTVGASWAALFASQGLTVTLYDETADALEKGLIAAKEALNRLETAGLLQKGYADACATRLRPVDTIEAAVSESDFIQETVFEDYVVKEHVWRQIEKSAPPTAVIASSTSGLLISRLASVLEKPERALVAHPFNPPHLIPLVELVPGPKTDPGVVQSVKTFYKGLNKAPVVLSKEVAGHIANRLQAAIWREAVSLVHQGVSSVQDVDIALHQGPGLRWAIMGQHSIFDLGGGDGGYRGFFDGPIGKGCFETVWASMEHWDKAPQEAKDSAIRGVDSWFEETGTTRAQLASWRDAQLARIITAKRLHPSPRQR
eukprot:TRINITY_DN13305_c1_g1_i1.p1 TRINITY_DN13305_c1_g1~~TRINITY_DN13305_c1_g1_i1.p1  ORF type:complete len:382 (+),score=36.76 TRINITY_DN13305_c1_g1_i1:59-1147(+)